MESTIISYSNKKNIYLYDINLSLSILIHPKLEKVIKNRGLEESFDPYYFKKQYPADKTVNILESLGQQICWKKHITRDEL